MDGSTMANTKKCANPVCTCTPTDGSKYSSVHCEAISRKSEIVCACGHPGCRSDATQI